MIKILCIIISLSFAFNSSISDENQQMVQQILGETDKPRIDFSLLTPQDSLITLSDLRDKVVFVNFWATWCGPCRMEIPEFNALQKKYEEYGFEILSISISDTKKQLIDFSKVYEIDYTLLYGSGEDITKVSNDFGGIYAVPMSFILDRKGNIIKKIPGAVLGNYNPALLMDIVYTIEKELGIINLEEDLNN